MRTEFLNLATAYLMEWKSIYDCAEWLASIDWEDAGLDPESLKVAGLLELLATEVAEGLRPEADFRQEVAEFVEKTTSFKYSMQTSTGVANSSNDITDRPPELIVPGVQGLQSWNISPLQVPA